MAESRGFNFFRPRRRLKTRSPHTSNWKRMLYIPAFLAILVYANFNLPVHESLTKTIRMSGGDDLKQVGELDLETGFYQSITVLETLYSKKSKFQDIQVYRTKHFGNALVLDGAIQITDRDLDSYNEMMAHVPLFQHKQPKRVLIIGGGDGYVLQEVLKHKSVEHVDHVELDEDMIAVCKKYFRAGKAWEDPRVHLHIADGCKFIRDSKDSFYDAVIQDSSDPWEFESGMRKPLPSAVLFTPEHFGEVYRILTPAGIFNFQSESINFPTILEGIALWRKQALHVGFSRVRYGSIGIPTYPTGQIGMLFCEKDPSAASSINEIEERYQTIVKNNLPTSYYHPPLQQSTFDIVPLWAKKAIYNSDGSTE